MAAPKVRVQGSSAEIVEELVEMVRDRALRLAASERPLCHEGWMPWGGGSCA
jgi:hypothetical protein